MSVLIAIVLGFASGVFLRSLFFFGWEPVIFVLILAALFGAAGFLKPRRGGGLGAVLGAAGFLKPRRVYALGAAFFLLAMFGMVRASLADTPLPDAFLRDLKHRVSYEGVVVAGPDGRG